MKSLYEKINGNYIEIREVRIPTFVSVDKNYEIGFWEEGIKSI